MLKNAHARLRIIATILAFSGAFAWGEGSIIEIREGLSIGRVGGAGGRAVVSADAIADLLARGTFQPPKAGDRVVLANGTSLQWSTIKAGDNGVFQVAGYLACNVDLPQAAVMLIEVAGGSVTYVNGEARAGDPYSYGYLRLPVPLHAGSNSLLIASARGRVKVRLLPAAAIASLDATDPTLPDVLESDHGTLVGAVVVQNFTDKPLSDLQLIATVGDDSRNTSTPTAVATIAPMTIRKVPFGFGLPSKLSGEKIAINLELRQGELTSLFRVPVSVRIRKPPQEYRRTFVSRIDGSVQYYAVNPASKPSDTNVLALTLHGASVEAQGQADAYGPHDDVTLVAPTNRRPYGFDWEDIGRLDAMEVLEMAEKTIPHDPQRVVLTGHSMGGHGTWQIGLTLPDRFAAIGPSAGWSSFATYGGGGGARGNANPSPIQQILSRANGPSNTLSLVRNSLMQEVYILHGDVDDNVPVREARMMRAALEKFHPRLSYHEEKGASHWWGSKCVDWPPMVAMFETVRLPLEKDVNEIEFTTADPAISGRCNWATIQQQIEPMNLSTIKLHRKADAVTGETENVAQLSFDSPATTAMRRLELDGDTVDLPDPAPKELLVAKQGGHWKALRKQNPHEKGAGRGGPFKQVFDHAVMFVYGAAGNEAENTANYTSARLLAESLYYRGNGAVDVLSDREFLQDLATGARNVILFGNADTNSAWASLLAKSPIDVHRGRIVQGDQHFDGDDLAAIFLQPRTGSDGALVGVIAGTGPIGQHAADRLPFLASGAALPDWMIFGEDCLRKGIGGVRGAGFFGNDWTYLPEQSGWAISPRQ